ncbi:hypothetical protein HAX54_043571, partial [Datura stramonium]|nr:hypothetical protein [Datura stramonium]
EMTSYRDGNEAGRKRHDYTLTGALWDNQYTVVLKLRYRILCAEVDGCIYVISITDDPAYSVKPLLENYSVNYTRRIQALT